MTKNAILKKIRKTLFCIFTLTLVFSTFSCSISDDNDTQKNDTPTENNTNIESNKTQNIPEGNEKVKSKAIAKGSPFGKLKKILICIL